MEERNMEIYPLNLLLAVKRSAHLDLPSELTADIRDGVRYALYTLDAQSQRVLQLRYAQFLPREEAAEALGIPVEQLKEQEQRALKNLRVPYRWDFMCYGIQGSLKVTKEKAFRKGYDQGYQRGLEDGRSGILPETPEDAVLDLPLEMLGLSSRALNCLRLTGFQRIREAAECPENRIRVMRNLGPITANEIAQALTAKGIRYTAWDKFLL